MRNLIRYLELVIEQEKKLANSLIKCSKELSFSEEAEALKFFSQDESIQVISSIDIIYIYL